jgi:hypothetical protein
LDYLWEAHVAWTDAAIAGGAALAGVALQQLLTWRSEGRRTQQEKVERGRQEQHAALVDAVKAGRRVQRALVDLKAPPDPTSAQRVFGAEVDRLTEAVAVVRLLVIDERVLRQADAFEEHAKRLERHYRPEDQGALRLSPLIDTIRQYEGIGQ